MEVGLVDYIEIYYDEFRKKIQTRNDLLELSLKFNGEFSIQYSKFEKELSKYDFLISRGYLKWVAYRDEGTNNNNHSFVCFSNKGNDLLNSEFYKLAGILFKE